MRLEKLKLIIVGIFLFALSIPFIINNQHIIKGEAAAEKRCSWPEGDPDKGQLSSWLGVRSLWSPTSGITSVMGDIKYITSQGKSSSPDDPTDGSIWIMLTGKNDQELVQIGILERDSGPQFFSAWGKDFMTGGGYYCEMYFGSVTKNLFYQFRIDHLNGNFILYINNNEVQRISDQEMRWSEIYSADIFGETHGNEGYAEIPAGEVKNIKTNNSIKLNVLGAGPVAEAAIIDFFDDPNNPSGFRIIEKKISPTPPPTPTKTIIPYKECVPNGIQRCLSGDKWQQCNNGSWVNYTCNSGYVCSMVKANDASCVKKSSTNPTVTPKPTPQCSPNGAQRCLSGSKWQQCNNGRWVNYTCRTNYVCKLVRTNDVSCVRKSSSPTSSPTPTKVPTNTNPSPIPPSAKCSYGFADLDQDGYGAGSYGCHYNSVSVSGNDCNDSNSLVHPGQTIGFSNPDSRGSYDYNCDGIATTTNAGGGSKYSQYGNVAAQSYNNGSSCTNGNYSGFWHTISSITNSDCGKNVTIQPCNYIYYSSSSCIGSIKGYNQCSSRIISCN